jgi:SagB-type dehydrogenase family enzyme
LYNALKERKSTKAFHPQAISEDMLSNLLWAAFGVNRPDTGKRTAPSAVNSQEMDIYVILATGVYLYDASAHQLTPILATDLRALAGTQDYVKDAPINFLYIADYAKMRASFSPTKKALFSASHAGFIGQNVYLCCASEGLGTVFRDSIDRAALREILKLRKDQDIVFAQTIGYIRDEEKE